MLLKIGWFRLTVTVRMIDILTFISSAVTPYTSTVNYFDTSVMLSCTASGLSSEVDSSWTPASAIVIEVLILIFSIHAHCTVRTMY